MFSRKKFEAVNQEQASLPVAEDEEEQDTQPRVIRMHFLRQAVDSILSIDPKDSIPLREAIYRSENANSLKLMNYASWKVALVSISEKKPHLLAGGVLAGCYLFVFTILKMTVLL
jgi:hypothetical protein